MKNKYGKLTDATAAKDWNKARNQTTLARQWGVNPSTVTRRLQRLERTGLITRTREGREVLASPVAPPKFESAFERFAIKDGCILVGSDAHYWPGEESTAHRAFVAFTRLLKPKAVILNGDALDFPSISRHPPIGWESLPTLEEELGECQERLGEIVSVGPKGCRYYWPLGNHDARFNTRLAALTPEFRNVPGTRLVHHFPDWTPCWAVELGGQNGAMVKHRFKGGDNAPHNNTLWAGRTMVTGHLHSQKVTPLTDYNGTRYGVDTGCLASPLGPQFLYREANPSNWRSGFCVLSWWKGSLLPPELVTVFDEAAGLVVWRGQVMKV